MYSVTFKNIFVWFSLDIEYNQFYKFFKCVYVCVSLPACICMKVYVHVSVDSRRVVAPLELELRMFVGQPACDFIPMTRTLVFLIV